MKEVYRYLTLFIERTYLQYGAYSGDTKEVPKKKKLMM